VSDPTRPARPTAAFQDRATAGARGLGKVLVGFKDFVSRGNVVELAVAVVIGAAFSKVVTSVVEGFINPLIAAIFGEHNLSNVWNFTINNATFSIGSILNALLNFLLTAAAIYFVIIVPVNALATRRKRGDEPEPAAPAEDVLLLQEIRDLLANRLTPAVANDATPGSGQGRHGAPGTPNAGPGAGPAGGGYPTR
jgi:large conductance mechanosensitive channel